MTSDPSHLRHLFAPTLAQMEVIADEAFAGLRTVRLLKVVRFFPAMRNLMHQLFSALPKASTILTLLVLFVFTTAVVGLQLFGSLYVDAVAAGKLHAIPRANFLTIGSSVLTVFIVMEGEHWDEIMDEHMVLAGPW